MNGVNLIPRSRILGQRARRRARWWITGVGLYLGFLAVALVVSHGLGSSDDRSLRTAIVEANARIASIERRVSGAREDLDQVAALFFANREVGSQPDWGIFLAMLAETAGEEIVLRGLRVETDKAPDRGTAAGSEAAARGTSRREIRVEVNGIGREQSHVTDLLLRLEDIDLFRDVKLNDTRREAFLDGFAVSFRIGFQLDSELDSEGNAR
jgi:hypothetical protein